MIDDLKHNLTKFCTSCQPFVDTMSDTTTPCVYDVPTLLSYADCIDPEQARHRARQLLKQNKQSIAGPMDLSAFMDRFLPLGGRPFADASSQRLSDQGAFNDVPLRAETSTEIITPLCAALNESAEDTSRCHGFVFDVAATRTVHPESYGYICCYTRSNSETVKAVDASSRTDFGYAELFIGVSPDPLCDSFNDPPSDLVDRSTHEFLSRPSTPERQKYIDDLLGQHMSYVSEIFERQPRIFLFSLAVHGSLARMFFWDRSACIVSETFDIRARADILCEFLWRFSDRGDTGRGHDVTIQCALPREERLFRRAIREHAATQLGEGEDLKAELDRHYVPGKVYATEVLYSGTIACEDNTLRYVFSRPVASSNTLAHSGTRGFWAFDVLKWTVVFLKDTWRDLALESEGAVLTRLRDLQIRNVSVLAWHGDVSWFAEHPKSLCVLNTMRNVLQKDSRIHRDISIDNIVLVKEPDDHVRRGYLIDWTSSCTLDEEYGEAKVTGRAGAWQFTSLRLLKSVEPNEQRHLFEDDMESLLWVVFYSALMWQPHNYSDITLRDVMRDLFDARVWSPAGKAWLGGHSKELYLRSRGGMPALKFDSESLQKWMDMMVAYRSPLRSDASKFKFKWPDHAFIHKFWTKFVDTNVLETANRVEHVPADDSVKDDQTELGAASDQGRSSQFSISSENTMIPVYDIPVFLGPETRPSAQEHVKNCRNTVVGPMPPFKFLDTFLSISSSKGTSCHLPSTDAFNGVPRVASTADEISGALVATLNHSTADVSRCPGFVFQSARTPPWNLKKAHVCCFSPDGFEAVRDAMDSPRVEYGYAELFLDISPEPSLDYFEDPLPKDTPNRSVHELLSQSPNNSGQIEELFGQHIEYVVEVFTRQSRAFVFTVAMHGSSTRFLRWDRSGCVVSESFDIRTHPELLCDFLWRFSQATPAGRGHDTSVKHAAPPDEKTFRDAIRAYAATQLFPGEDLEGEVERHYAPRRVYEVQLLSRDGHTREDKPRKMLFSRPVASSCTLAGHGTRGYWAVLAHEDGMKEVVFLKDTWRRSEGGVAVEGEVLRELRHRSVQFAPVMKLHGDVSYPEGTSPGNDAVQKSVNMVEYPDWAARVNGRRRKLRQRTHYRLVMGPAGRPFDTQRSAEELLHSCYDVFTAMKMALETGNLLHCDISTGNIVLVKEPDSDIRKGYLIDWGLSVKANEDNEALSSGRRGTRWFMSRRILQMPSSDILHTFEDDMESLLYVVLYSALVLHSSDLTDRQRERRLQIFTQKSVNTDGEHYGGLGKMENAMNRKYTRGVRFDSPALGEWLDTMMAYHSPLPEHGDKHNNKWNVKAIDGFWKDFLEPRALATSTRRPTKPRIGHHAEAKRGRKDQALATGKRKRASSPDPLPVNKKSRVKSNELAPPTLRRSARLKEYEEKAKSRIPPIVIPAPTDIRRNGGMMDGSSRLARRRRRHI
ncbi:uncharacterized protein BXZ73DRAFT_101231 [Epithele typhae]|uniref:uncharacterized protein n=1 Tax=Epithele typhae TaxID=378194 RepID=UPI002008C4D5|nr:uncharacterized protein BXZ73DRAFT_101231 [Epithele typhae]KAH9932689.1 hypothetical protein BXZ73DRAFT_101231 [Epithele typhae]